MVAQSMAGTIALELALRRRAAHRSAGAGEPARASARCPCCASAPTAAPSVGRTRDAVPRDARQRGARASRWCTATRRASRPARHGSVLGAVAVSGVLRARCGGWPPGSSGSVRRPMTARRLEPCARRLGGARRPRPLVRDARRTWQRWSQRRATRGACVEAGGHAVNEELPHEVMRASCTLTRTLECERPRRVRFQGSVDADQVGR